MATIDRFHSTMVNCFAKAGFVVSPSYDEEEVDQPPNGMTQAFVDVGSSLECHGVLLDEEICSSVCQPE